MHNRRAGSGSEYRRERHSFGSGTTGLVFHSGGDFDLTHTRPNFPACDPEKTGAEFNRPPDAQDLGSVLHHAGTLDQWWRGAQARPPFQHRRQPVAHAGGNRLGFDAYRCWRQRCWRRTLSLRGQPLRSRHQWGLASDDNARTFYFLFRLGAVAAIGEEDGTTIGDKQSSRTASKATEIANVGEVRDQQGVKLVARERGLEPAQASSMVHGSRVHDSAVHGMECSRVLEADGWKLVTAKAKPPGSRQVLRESRRLWRDLTSRLCLNDARSDEENQFLV